MAVNKLYNFSDRYELVWENADPTSGFAAQTVQINLSGKKWIIVEARVTTSTSYGMEFEAPIGSQMYHMAIFSNAFNAPGTTAAPYVYSRRFSSSATGVTFEGSFRKVTNATTAPTTSNNYAVPVKIWAK